MTRALAVILFSMAFVAAGGTPAQDFAQNPGQASRREIGPDRGPDDGLALIDQEVFTARVVAVEMADRLVLIRDGEKIGVRLLGIAASSPETSFGAQALQFVEDRVLRKEVRVALRGGRSDSGTQARIWIGTSDDAADLGVDLVAAGLAEVCAGSHRDELLEAAQDRAREAGLGLWSDPESGPPRPCDRPSH